MLDPLMTLLVAKAKAVSLVAGTALATTALVGGGAVAYTAVSSDTELTAETSTSQDVDPTQSTGDATVSATPTVGITPPTETEAAPVQVDEDADGLDDASGLPMGFVCDETRNHGQNVSTFARSLPKGPGRGRLVSAVAKSDCGKSAEPEEAELEAAEVEAIEEAEEAKPVKPVKPAKADKPAKAQKPAKSQQPAQADKPAKSGKPAKAEGKGNGKG